MAGEIQTPTDWREQLPFELKTNDSLSKFKDVIGLAKSYTELEKSMGSRVHIPSADAKPEEYEKFYKQWGRPDKHDDYKFPEKLPEGFSINEEFGGAVKSLGHKLGLNPKQFSELVQWGIEQSVAIEGAQKTERETRNKGLKDKWGFAYDSNKEKALRTLNMLVGGKADHPFAAFLKSSGMIDAPEFQEFMLELNEKFGEDKFVDSKVQQAALDKDNAGKKIREMQADQKGPYWNENHPQHVDAVKEMNRLYAIAYGEEK